MPRIARKPSASSLYHVMNRGSGKQIIFENDEDRAYFMKTLDSLIEQASGKLHAWCLMDNHYHLLLEVEFERLSALMHHLQTSYAGYFNRVHGRAGALFGTRFRSEPVETNDYLITVVRYIHENPVKAGLAGGLHYAWSSYGEYVGTPRHIDPTFVIGVFGGQAQFVSFHEGAHEDARCMNFPDKVPRLSDDRAKEIAVISLGRDLSQVKGLSRTERDAALIKLRKGGLGVRQIERLTGVSLSVISRVTRDVVER